MQRAWVLVFVLACGGTSRAPQSAASPAPVAAFAGVPCDTAVGKMMDALTANKPDVPPSEVKRFHDLFVAHCQSDAWTPQVRDCFGRMTTLDEADKCGAQMTEPQRQALDDATKPGPEEKPDALVQPAPGGGNAPATSSAPASAPAPTMQPAPPPSRGPKKGGDPCEGGD